MTFSFSTEPILEPPSIVAERMNPKPTTYPNTVGELLDVPIGKLQGCIGGDKLYRYVVREHCDI